MWRQLVDLSGLEIEGLFMRSGVICYAAAFVVVGAIFLGRERSGCREQLTQHVRNCIRVRSVFWRGDSEWGTTARNSLTAAHRTLPIRNGDRSN